MGLNQTEFAEKLETSQNLISKYEKGQVELPFKIINNLNKVFNININWLLTNTGNMFRTNETPKKDINDTSNLLVENKSLFKDELLNDIQKLSQKRQEYYYHRIKADLIEDELKSD
ncbi:transcriptional regulator, XRE family [Arcobacter defluvii]|uniref:Transcriptional regulator, XRE family n=1 Tax=Arcobacter defluvii TaxID=873191 RepID=A0AAE7BH36_9BACT|nr:transcriptional regulator, XRE family [Arcobacter defluvii]QKF77847.1 transcriptional regulator, XRE family [Arcobacter defluvii]